MTGQMGALLVVASLAGCVAGDGESYTVVPEVQADRDLRIGSVDDPGTALTAFRALAVGSDGRIFTLHRQENAIRVHAASGRFLRAIGREGEGPGEFRGLLDLGILGDTLWAFDSDLYRFTVFDQDGELLGMRSFRIDLGDANRNPARPRGLLHDGGFWGSPPAWSREVADGTLTEVPLLRLDTAGAVTDTIAVRPLESSTWRLADPDSPSGFQSYRDQPFDETRLVALAPDAAEVIMVDRTASAEAGSGEFRVTRLTFEGDTLFSRTFRYRPKPIHAAAPDSLAREFAGFLADLPPEFRANAPTFERGVGLALETLHLPPHHPPVRLLLPGRDGTIWLAREDDGSAALAWWVLDRDGEPVGQVMLPRGLEVMAADRDHVWGAEHDELDVPYIVRYTIRRE